MAFCGNCGAEIETGAKFCGGCGQPVMEAAKGGEETKFHDVPHVDELPVKKRGRWKKVVTYIIIAFFVLGTTSYIRANFKDWIKSNKFGLGKLSALFPQKAEETKKVSSKPVPLKPTPTPPPPQPSPQRKILEKEKFVYSKPTPVEPPRVVPEVKMGISYIGVEIQNLTKEVADSVGLMEGAGVLVKSVKRGGPADSAGILPGDVILRFKDTWVTDARILSDLVKSTPSGTSSPVYIDRRGKRYNFAILVGELKKEDISHTPSPPPPPSQQARVQNRQYYETGAKQALDYKDFQKLRLVLDEGLMHYPDSATLWSYEGAYYYFYKDSGPWSFRREKALIASKKALQIEPIGKYRFNLGSVYLYMFQDYSSALDCYEKAPDYARSNPSVYYHMARCYEELKYLHLAVSHYEKFLQAAPNDQNAQDARNRLAKLR